MRVAAFLIAFIAVEALCRPRTDPIFFCPTHRTYALPGVSFDVVVTHGDYLFADNRWGWLAPHPRSTSIAIGSRWIPAVHPLAVLAGLIAAAMVHAGARNARPRTAATD